MDKTIWQYRGFHAFVTIAFINAFTDLGHKIIIQNTLIKLYDGTELRVYTAIIQALILLPFILTFTPAGFLSDRFPKYRIIQICSFLAIPLTILITVCYFLGWFWPAFWLTFILGLQSAIYSPAKFGFIRELVSKGRLAQGNSAVQAVSIAAILAGTMVYTLMFEHWYTPAAQTPGEIMNTVKYAGFFLVLGTIIEFSLSFRLPRIPSSAPKLRFDWGHYINTGYLRDNLRDAWNHEGIRLSIVGLAVFMGINQVVLANFAAHLEEIRGIDDTRIANGLMALGGIGIVFGSILAGKVSRNYIETGLIPLGALGICAFLVGLPFVHDLYWMAGMFLLYGMFGGMFIVPLNALIQYFAKEGEAGRVIATNNFVQYWMMLLFLILSIGLAWGGYSNQATFFLLAVITLIGTIYTLTRLPQSFLRYLLTMLFLRHYRVQVLGMRNIPANGGVLLLGNHVSWLDWAMLQIASPRPVRFVMTRVIYERWYLKGFLDLFQVIPITRGGSKDALARVQEALVQGQCVALFPEGQISYNGHLSVFHAGFERAVRETNAIIVPFYLRGLWGSRFSYSSGKYRESTLDDHGRRITVAFGDPLPATTSAVAVKQAVQATSIIAWREYVETLPPLGVSMLRMAKSRGGQLAVSDGHVAMSHARFLTAVIAFLKPLQPVLNHTQRIGILLPPSNGGAIANTAALFNGNTLVNLNYTTSVENLIHAVRSAGVRTVLTSRLFEVKLLGRGLDLAPLREEVEFLYLEDVKENLSRGTLLGAWLQANLLPTSLLRLLHVKTVHPEDTAAILFSSGSEGKPKGVCLSHRNIMANIKQIASVLNPDQDDVMLNSLPTFHAFGFTVTTLFPLVEGVPMVCQPDPTDAKAVAKLVAQYKVTIMTGTSTFYRMYCRSRKSHALMFQSLRLVVAGAERLHPDTRREFREKFGKTMYEGYGVTETAPVASVNIPDILMSYAGDIQIGNKPGTVGPPLPGTLIRVVDPETLETLPVGEGGLILIAGPQVMQGYLDNPEKTAEAIVMLDGFRWYKTGDKGTLDEDGFLTILDRYSRFAKLGGEMVGLGTVELEISQVLDNPEESEVLAVALPDPGKGEKLVLLVAGEDPAGLKAKVMQSGINPLMIPKSFLAVEAIPKLGSGKTDFATAKKLAGVGEQR